jgi:hypothetical protein
LTLQRPHGHLQVQSQPQSLTCRQHRPEATTQYTVDIVGVVMQGMPGITSEVVEVLSQTSVELSKTRKGKKVAPATLATPDDLERFSLLASQPLHSTKQVRAAPWAGALLGRLQDTCGCL